MPLAPHICAPDHSHLAEEPSALQPDYVFNRCVVHCNMSLCQSTMRALSAPNANESSGMAAAEKSVVLGKGGEQREGQKEG